MTEKIFTPSKPAIRRLVMTLTSAGTANPTFKILQNTLKRNIIAVVRAGTGDYRISLGAPDVFTAGNTVAFIKGTDRDKNLTAINIGVRDYQILQTTILTGALVDAIAPQTVIEIRVYDMINENQLP